MTFSFGLRLRQSTFMIRGDCHARLLRLRISRDRKRRGNG
jgi:hypothetical protein